MPASHLSSQSNPKLLTLMRSKLRLGHSLRLEGHLPRARTPTRLPVVLTRSEVARVLGQLEGGYRLVGMLLYGSGMRLLECLTLRVKDVDLERGELRIRRGKGGVDRVTVLPEAVRPSLAAHLGRVRALASPRVVRAQIPAVVLIRGVGLIRTVGIARHAVKRKRIHALPCSSVQVGILQPADGVQ